MKALNTIKFITESTVTFNGWLDAIDKAETYEAARQRGYGALGFLDCMITFLNCSICTENNDFTGDLGEVLDEWERTIYSRLINKAVETKQPTDVIVKLFKKRDDLTE